MGLQAGPGAGPHQTRQLAVQRGLREDAAERGAAADEEQGPADGDVLRVGGLWHGALQGILPHDGRPQQPLPQERGVLPGERLNRFC